MPKRRLQLSDPPDNTTAAVEAAVPGPGPSTKRPKHNGDDDPPPAAAEAAAQAMNRQMADPSEAEVQWQGAEALALADCVAHVDTAAGEPPPRPPLPPQQQQLPHGQQQLQQQQGQRRPAGASAERRRQTVLPFAPEAVAAAAEGKRAFARDASPWGGGRGGRSEVVTAEGWRDLGQGCEVGGRVGGQGCGVGGRAPHVGLIPAMQLSSACVLQPATRAEQAALRARVVAALSSRPTTPRCPPHFALLRRHDSLPHFPCINPDPCTLRSQQKHIFWSVLHQFWTCNRPQSRT